MEIFNTWLILNIIMIMMTNTAGEDCMKLYRGSQVQWHTIFP